MQFQQIFTYRNAIEALVAEEVQLQIKNLPPRLIKYINPTQVLAYALNQLPPLYATSEKGWHLQQQKAKDKLSHQIVIAVRRGIAAVQRDPLKPATLIILSEEFENNQSLSDLPKLEELLRQEPAF